MVHMCLLCRRPTLFFFLYRGGGRDIFFLFVFFTVYCRVSQLPLKASHFKVAAYTLKVPWAMGNVLEPRQADLRSHSSVTGRFERVQVKALGVHPVPRGCQTDRSSEREPSGLFFLFLE